MSTRATIYYDERVHIYLELLDDCIYVETIGEGTLTNSRLMTGEEWAERGFPLASALLVATHIEVSDSSGEKVKE